MKLTINKPVEYEAKFLEVDAGVRYWEDAKVNGVYDTDCEETDGSPIMPCAEYIGEQHRVLRGENWRWRPVIEIETGQIVNWKLGVKASVGYKVCDDFSCDIIDADKKVIISYDGYVPKIMCPAEEGFGDYILMDIDENGFIQKWKKELISKFVEEEN